MDGGDDLTHGVAAYAIGLAAEAGLSDKGKAKCALAGVVRDRVRDEVYAHALRNLAHDGRLANAGWAHHEDRSLHLGRDEVKSGLVLR